MTSTYNQASPKVPPSVMYKLLAINHPLNSVQPQYHFHLYPPPHILLP